MKTARYKHSRLTVYNRLVRVIVTLEKLDPLRWSPTLLRDELELALGELEDITNAMDTLAPVKSQPHVTGRQAHNLKGG
jgi:hypothetical protein